MTPLVSVILPCFNGERFLGEALQSVQGQTWTNLECLVVDDQSTDRSRDLVLRRAREDGRIRLLPKEHGGISAARNFGLDHARGQWIQLLDCDDWLHRDKLRCQLSYYNGSSHGEAVVLYSDIVDVLYDAHEDVTLRRHAHRFGGLSHQDLLDRMLAWNFNGGCPLHVNNALIHKSVWTHRRFREDLATCEDLEFFISLLRSDVQFVHTPIDGMFYRTHGSNTSGRRDKLICSWLQILEEIGQQEPELLTRAASLSDLTKHAILAGDRSQFDRLMHLHELSGGQVYLGRGRLGLKGPWILELLFQMRPLIRFRSRILATCRNLARMMPVNLHEPSQQPT